MSRDDRDRSRDEDRGADDDQTVVRAASRSSKIETHSGTSGVIRVVSRGGAKRQEADSHLEEVTVIRGRDAGSSHEQPADGDATVLRSDERRGPADRGGAPDETVVRREERRPPKSAEPAGGANAETVIRDTPNKAPSPAPGAEDATVMRGSRDVTQQVPDTAPAEPASGADDATVMRGSDNATYQLRRDQPVQPETGADDATVMRGADSATQPLRRSVPPQREPGADDATAMRDEGGSDDATVMNVSGGDDATVMKPGATTQQEADTTYIASVGPQAAPSRAQSSSQAGRLLKNRFVLEEKLGSGGMGDVYKALDLRQQEAQDRNPYVAIKLLNERFGKHKDAFISLQREASKTRSMHSKNIMGVYDFDREGDTFFMAMELLDGEPLDDFLKAHPEGVSHEDAWNIIRGYSEGLKAAHAENIVHSDFKPGNIYYTRDKIAKVFDFGIARAVQNPGTSTEGKEETVFDPGSLGALTPTYASYEMLTGQVPSKSDDVYAAALVAYELFTGKHPYNRVPADKALAQGLEPEPVAFLKRRHWRALKKGLALKGEDRTSTIDEFIEGMFSEDPPILRYSIIGLVMAGIIGFSTYTFMFAPEANQELIANQQTAALRKADLNSLLEDPKLTEQWSLDVREKLQALEKVNNTLVEQFSQAPDPQLKQNRDDVMVKFVTEIRNLREKYSASGDRADASDYLKSASEYLDRLKQYFAFDPDVLRSAELALNDSLQLRDIERERIHQADEAAAAAAAAQRAEEERQAAIDAANKKRLDEYNQNASALIELYKCRKGIDDLDGMQRYIGNLERIDPERFAADRAGVVGGIAKCIDRTKVKNPDLARDLQKRGVAIFPDETAIASIVISDLDPCAKPSLVGTGARPRSVCEDDLEAGFPGPELVVIPDTTGNPKFAVSRTEIKVGDYNAFCEATGCDVLPGAPGLPATGLSVDQARAYLAWLSDQSGRKYRLPTVEEWRYAAKTDKEGPVDPNVNCTVESRGVRLGESLVNALSGKPNRWGLYNEVGNAQEWATEGDSLEAMGGAHTDPKVECSADLMRAHAGKADPVTGFRVLRQIGNAEGAG